MPHSAPGTPFPMLPETPMVLVSEVGNYDGNDGSRIYIVGSNIVFMLRAGDMECEAALPIEQLLDAIGSYNHQHES